MQRKALRPGGWRRLGRGAWSSLLMELPSCVVFDKACGKVEQGRDFKVFIVGSSATITRSST